MWPRHTGDFSVLRIYAGSRNEPASYAPENKPYQPESFFKISMKGLNEGDFTMVFGYPGTTNEYLTSYAIEQIQEVENPHKIAIRTAKLNVINAAMESDELLRIKYASKAAGVANAWKKWQGEIKGLKRFRTVAKKQEEEKAFRQWAGTQEEYATLLEKYKHLYGQRKDLVLAAAYVNEAGKKGAEIVGWSANIARLLKDSAEKEQILIYADEYYKDYDRNTDKKILSEMLRLYNRNLAPEWIPEEVRKAAGKKGIDVYVDKLFETSVLADRETFVQFLENNRLKAYKKLQKDPAYRLYVSIDQLYKKQIQPELTLSLIHI